MPMKKHESIKAGDIWWVDLVIKKDETVGHETKKTRPCLVLANCPETKMITIAPFFSNLETRRFPHTYTIKKHDGNGLDNDSVVALFQIRSLDYYRFKSFSGTIKKDDFKKIRILISNFLQL